MGLETCNVFFVYSPYFISNSENMFKRFLERKFIIRMEVFFLLTLKVKNNII